MYTSAPGLVYGFHGCDATTAEAVFAGRTTLRASHNDYDWLGHGVYFWENDYERALQFAQDARQAPVRSAGRIQQPAVVGAIIELKHCLNLLEQGSLQKLKDSFEKLKRSAVRNGLRLVENRILESEPEPSLRYLDCAVMENLHEYRQRSDAAPFDSVRGAFWEGRPLYPTAGFRERNHIQLCIRNPACIKGYFRPLLANAA